MKAEILFILGHRDKPITRKQLQESLRESGEFANLSWTSADRQIRSAIEEMITRDGHCIESSEKGYSLIKDGNQVNRAILYMNAKIKSLAIRKNCLLKNWFARQENRESRKQYRFEFNEETFLKFEFA